MFWFCRFAHNFYRWSRLRARRMHHVLSRKPLTSSMSLRPRCSCATCKRWPRFPPRRIPPLSSLSPSNWWRAMSITDQSVTGRDVRWQAYSGVLCQKQVSRAGTSKYMPRILWDVITCPCCPWYLHNTPLSWEEFCRLAVPVGRMDLVGKICDIQNWFNALTATINTSQPEEYGRHFVDPILKFIFILSTDVSDLTKLRHALTTL